MRLEAAVPAVSLLAVLTLSRPFGIEGSGGRLSWLGKEAARTGWRAGSKEQGAREGWQQVMRKCRQDKAGPPNGDPQRAVASKWTERASLSEACLRQTEPGGPLSTSSCCGPGSGGVAGEVAEGRGWSKMQTRGLGDRKGVRPGSGLSGPFTQLLPTLRQQQEAGIGRHRQA